MSFLIIILFIAMGWLSKTKAWLSDTQIGVINQYVISICLPAIALLKIPKLQIELSLIFPMFMGWMLIPVLFLIIVGLSKKYHWSKATTGCLLLLTCFGNTSFVGFPIIQAFYGDSALAYAVVYDQLGSFLGLAIVGNFFIARYAHSSQDTTTKQKVVALSKKVLLFPPFIGLVIAFLFGEVYLTASVEIVLSTIATTLIPTTMFLVGLHFEFRLPKRYYSPLFWGLFTKMLVAPCLAFIILKSFQQSGVAAYVTLMEASMPPMVTASILAIYAKLSPQLAAAAVGYGLVVAVAVMPMIYWMSHFL